MKNHRKFIPGIAILSCFGIVVSYVSDASYKRSEVAKSATYDTSASISPVAWKNPYKGAPIQETTTATDALAFAKLFENRVGEVRSYQDGSSQKLEILDKQGKLLYSFKMNDSVSTKRRGIVAIEAL